MDNVLLGTAFDDIQSFFFSKFTPQFATVAMDVIDILLTIKYPDLLDILSNEIYDTSNEDSEKQSEEVCDRLAECVVDALQQQGISVNTDSFNDIAEILAATYNCQRTDTPELYETVLNSDLSNEEILATVLEDFCHLKDTTIVACLESVSSTTVDGLRRYYTELKHRKVDEVVSPDLTALRENLKHFFDYIRQHPGKISTHAILGGAMADAGMKEGYEASVYYSYVIQQLKEIVKSSDVEFVALQLLSYFYYAIDTFKNPVKVYNQVGEALGIQPSQTIDVQASMIRIINEFDQFKKAKNDAGRLSIL